MLGFLNILKGMPIGGAVIGLVAGAAGWNAHSILVAAKEKKELQAKIELEQQVLADQRENNALLQDQLDTALNNVRVQYRDVVREVPVVVPQDPVCDYSAEFVRLFNRAARGGGAALTSTNPDDEMPGTAFDFTRGRSQGG